MRCSNRAASESWEPVIGRVALELAGIAERGSGKGGLTPRCVAAIDAGLAA